MQSPLKYRTVLLRCARLLSDEFNELLLPYQLNYSLWQVIYFVQHQQETTSIDIAKYLNVSKPSIAKRVHALIQLNVLKQSSTDDKREKKLTLTLKGQQLFKQCSEHIDHYESQLLSDFEIKDLERSFSTLSKLLTQLETNKTGAQI